MLSEKNLTNVDQWKECPAVIVTHVFDRIYMFSPRPSSPVLKDSVYAVRVKCILFSKRH